MISVTDADQSMTLYCHCIG